MAFEVKLRPYASEDSAQDLKVVVTGDTLSDGSLPPSMC